MNPFTVIGHRGACAHEPENTLRSIRRGLKDGADMIEIDVRLVDGEIVVIHDDSLDRTTDGNGSVYALTFPELRALSAGKGERIPTLAEVLNLTSGRVPLNIEFKDRAVVAPVCALIESWPREDVLVSCFDWECLREVRHLLPTVPIGILTAEASGSALAVAETLRAASLHLALPCLSAEYVAESRARRLPVLSFTVRTEADLEKVRACGADGCFADDPAWVRGLLEG
jgi:glycerophosphoryl diester phosphodiesterase